MNAVPSWLIVGMRPGQTAATTRSGVNLTLNRIGLEQTRSIGVGKTHVGQSQAFSYRTSHSGRRANLHAFRRRRRDRPDASGDHGRAARDPHADGGLRPPPHPLRPGIRKSRARPPRLTRCWKPIAPRSSSARSSRSNSTSFTTRSTAPSAKSQPCTARALTASEMAKVNGELGAVVGGTEHATQQILEPSRRSTRPPPRWPRTSRPTSRSCSARTLQERVVAIFEACNFQDLTGQRISKVMNTMKFIESTSSR